MNKLFLSAIFLAGSLASIGHAQPVEYVKICSLYGAAFHYIPGTDTCVNEETGETRQETEGGVWASQLPTKNQGHWATVPALECGLGRLVQVGVYKPSDFTVHVYQKFQTAPTAFSLHPGEFVSRLIMSGGFGDPIQPLAHNPGLSTQQFCLRVADPNFVIINNGGQPHAGPFCSGTPLGCISNSEILGTAAVYSVPVLGAPLVHYNTDVTGKAIGPPSTCGSQFIVTTGMGTYDPTTTGDPSSATPIPAGGTLSVWACIQQGIQ